MLACDDNITKTNDSELGEGVRSDSRETVFTVKFSLNNHFKAALNNFFRNHPSELLIQILLKSVLLDFKKLSALFIDR
jgi:hypothetical protein